MDMDAEINIKYILIDITLIMYYLVGSVFKINIKLYQMIIILFIDGSQEFDKNNINNNLN